MGRAVNLNQPLSPEDKAYLRERGKGYLIPANERRFGANGDQIAEGDVAGQPQENPFYDTDARNQAVYDQGGGHLPGTILDTDTGRLFDRENGVRVEYTGPGYTNSATDIRDSEQFFDSHGEDGDIDEDIVDEISSIRNVKELRQRCVDEGLEIPSGAKREDLEDALAIHLQDKRDAANGISEDGVINVDAQFENSEQSEQESAGKHEAPADSPTAGIE